MNRALRAATLGVLLFTPLALTACSAGQVNQTSTQLRDKVGPEVMVGDIELREVQLAYPTDGSYQAGDDAELTMAIVNNGAADDALTGISGTGFSGVRVTGSASGTVAATTSAAPTSSSAPASGTSGPRALDITIPADSSVFLGENAPTVTLTSLGQDLGPAQTLPLTFTFQKAGDVTLNVPVAAPASNVPQTSSYNFEPQTQANEPGNKAGAGNLESTSSSSNGG